MTATAPIQAPPVQGSASHERPPSWRVWVLAVRPATLPAGAVPVFVGTAMAAAEGLARPWAALLALFGALFIQIGTNLFNDYADFKKGADTAARLGPLRATQRGWLTPGAVIRGTIAAFALATACGVPLVVWGGWPVVAIGVASILMGLAYTGGPLPLAYHGLGEVFVLLAFGLLAVCGTYYVQALRWSWPCFAASLAVGLLACAILVVNNLRDRHTDALAGKRTLAVRFGGRFARWQYALTLGLAYAIPPLAYFLGLGHGGWFLPWLSVPLAFRAAERVARLEGAALNPVLGQTARLELTYGVLLCLGVML